MKEVIKVLLIEDHLIARIGINSIISMQPDMVVVAEAVNGAEGVRLYREHQPDVTLMDLQMAEMGGAEAMQKIRSEFPQAKIIILSSHSGDAEISRLLRLGACGYILKDVLDDELTSSVRAVHKGRKYIPANIGQILLEHLGAETLTPSEQKIVELVVRGLSVSTIADELFISPNTVKSHLKNIFGKLGVNDRSQLVTVALKRGVVSFDELNQVSFQQSA